MDKLQTMITEVSKEIKKTEKALRAEQLKNLSTVDELAELNAKKFYYETIVRKLQRLPTK